MTASQQKQALKRTWNMLRKEVQGFIKEQSIAELQRSVGKILAQAKRDYVRLTLKGDLQVNTKKFKADVKRIEKMIERLIQSEVRRAKQFLASTKKELSRLESQFEAAAKKRGINLNIGRGPKKTTKKKATRRATKKATKRAAST